MVDTDKLSLAPAFYTVREAAAVLRCDPATLYRAIRDDEFPVVKLRSRYVVPAQVLNQLIQDAVDTGACVDIAKIAAQRRTERDIRRLTGRERP
jgi:excisionase family DNA binding protein